MLRRRVEKLLGYTDHVRFIGVGVGGGTKEGVEIVTKEGVAQKKVGNLWLKWSSFLSKVELFDVLYSSDFVVRLLRDISHNYKLILIYFIYCKEFFYGPI